MERQFEKNCVVMCDCYDYRSDVYRCRNNHICHCSNKVHRYRCATTFMIIGYTLKLIRRHLLPVKHVFCVDCVTYILQHSQTLPLNKRKSLGFRSKLNQSIVSSFQHFNSINYSGQQLAQ